MRLASKAHVSRDTPNTGESAPGKRNKSEAFNFALPVRFSVLGFVMIILCSMQKTERSRGGVMMRQSNDDGGNGNSELAGAALR